MFQHEINCLGLFLFCLFCLVCCFVCVCGYLPVSPSLPPPPQVIPMSFGYMCNRAELLGIKFRKHSLMADTFDFLILEISRHSQVGFKSKIFLNEYSLCHIWEGIKASSMFTNLYLWKLIPFKLHWIGHPKDHRMTTHPRESLRNWTNTSFSSSFLPWDLL